MCRPKKKNFVDYQRFSKVNPKIVMDGGPRSVYLSIIQDFGPRLKRQEPINLLPCGQEKELKSTSNARQVSIILKGLGSDTYKCLIDKSDNAPRAAKKPDTTRAEAMEYLEKLKTAHVEYLDDVKDQSRAGVLDFLPLVYDDPEDTDDDWEDLVESSLSAMEVDKE